MAGKFGLLDVFADGFSNVAPHIGGLRAAEDIAGAMIESGRLDPAKVNDFGAFMSELNAALNAPNRMRGSSSQYQSIRPSQTPIKSHLDPLGYNGIQMTRPIEAYAPTSVSTGTLLPREQVNWEDLYKGSLLPMYWDRSSANRRITGVGNLELQRPQDTQGGLDFMRGESAQAQGSMGASGGSVVEGLLDRAKQIEDRTGEPVYGVTMSMAPPALDFYNVTANILGDIIQQEGTKRDLNALTRYMRAQPELADMPPINSEDFAPWLSNADTSQRQTFIRSYANDKFLKDTNLPRDAVGAARFAVTDPSQAYMPSGMGGLGIARIDTGAGVITDPLVPHAQYPKQWLGVYKGGNQVALPQELLFRDAFRKYYSPDYVNGRGVRGALDQAKATYTASRQLPEQVVDEALINSILQYTSNVNDRRLGTGVLDRFR